MTRTKLTAAEREARGEASFLKDRPARDAARREHLATTLQALDKTARICASARARMQGQQWGDVPMAARRKARIARRRELWAKYEAWRAACPMTQWELE